MGLESRCDDARTTERRVRAREGDEPDAREAGEVADGACDVAPVVGPDPEVAEKDVGTEAAGEGDRLRGAAGGLDGVALEGEYECEGVARAGIVVHDENALHDEVHMSTDPATDEAGAASGWARILADLAHDLRGAAGAAELWLELLERAGDEEKRARAKGELRGSIARTAQLATDFADAAAVVDGSGAGPALPFDFGVAVEASLHRNAAEAKSRRVAIELDLPADFACAVVGDEPAWGRAFDRMLRATIARAPAGAMLSLRVRALPGGGAELAIPCGDLELPGAGPLLALWSAPRADTRAFPLGLVLAQTHFAGVGGALSTRTDADGAWLVAVTG